MDDVVTAPPGRHGPGYFFRRFRQFIPDSFSDSLKLLPYIGILCENLFVNRFR
jgi:hypothetical protein